MKINMFALIGFCLFSINTYADVSYSKLSKKQFAVESNFETNAEIQSKMIDMIEQKRFKEISDKAKYLLNSEEYNIDGKFKHTALLDTLLYIVNRSRVTSNNYFIENISVGQEWIKAVPDSPLGYIYYALWIRQQAWKVRGGDYSANVSKKNIKYFGEQSIRNLNFLFDNYEVASKDPFYYYIVLITLADLGMEEEYLKAYQDGVIKFPKQRVIYNTYMSYFNNKWFGENYDAISMVVNDIQKLNPTDQDFNYYHIMYTANSYKYDLNKLGVNWGRVEQGAVNSLEKLASSRKIQDIQKLYCTYPGNKQRLARLFNSLKINQLDKSYIDESLSRCQS